MHNIKAVHLTSHSQKMVGMLGKKNPSPIYFKTHFGIHTLGMKYPIDVLILSSHGRVVKIAHSLMPNHVLFWPPIYQQVIELPAGYAKHHQIKMGDSVSV